MNRFEKLREKYMYRYCGYWGCVNLRKHVRKMDSMKDKMREYKTGERPKERE